MTADPSPRVDVEALERDLSDASMVLAMEGYTAGAKACSAAASLIARQGEEVERLRTLLDGLKWRSVDKDSMEFAATITYWQRDLIRAALQPEGPAGEVGQ